MKHWTPLGFSGGFLVDHVDLGDLLDSFAPGASERATGVSEACRFAVADYLAASWHQWNLPKHAELSAKVDRLTAAFAALDNALDALDRNDFLFLEKEFRMDRAAEVRNPLIDTTPEAHLARFRARAREFGKRVPEVFEALPTPMKPEPSLSTTPTPDHMALPFDGFIADMARVAEELGLAATSAKSMPDSQPSRFVMFVQATLKVFRDDIAAVDIDELLRIRAEQYDGMDARAMRVLIDGEIEAQSFALDVLRKHMDTEAAASWAISRALARLRASGVG